MIGINYEFNLFIFSLAWYLNRWWTPSTRRFRSPVWTRCADRRSCGLTSTVRWWSWGQVGISWISFEQFEQFFAFFFLQRFQTSCANCRRRRTSCRIRLPRYRKRCWRPWPRRCRPCPVPAVAAAAAATPTVPSRAPAECSKFCFPFVILPLNQFSSIKYDTQNCYVR